MTFDELLEKIIDQLQRQGRVSYGALKRRYELDEDYLQDIKAELIDAQQLAIDEGGKVLVLAEAQDNQHDLPNQEPDTSTPQPPTPPTEAERPQLTVMFCDLVGSNALSEQLDPEELREIVRAYQETSARVIQRYEGHIAQYLGDGILVHFGYPTAHEDDAERAVRAGLGILSALQQSPGGQSETSVQVRIGIHTGAVVVGSMGGGERQEQLALGETPNIAARLQGLASPDSVILSAATHQLVQGLFEYTDLGPQVIKGISAPFAVYQVTAESTAQGRFDVALRRGLTPFVGREQEIAILTDRWTKAQASAGQVVLLSGEAGIGKSRLLQVLKDRVDQDNAMRIEFRCSPYHENSVLYPVIDYFHRFLQFAPSDSPKTKLEKLTRVIADYDLPQTESLPLLAALLSLPHPENHPPLNMTPQRAKQQTLETLLALLLKQSEQQAVLVTVEDLHWTDPSTLELLNLLVEQAPTTRMLALLTFRPEFVPSWTMRSHLTQITLNHLDQQYVASMAEKVTGGKTLPSEVIQQIASKTDGVPLFVEELTKMVLESGLLHETEKIAWTSRIPRDCSSLRSSE